MDQITETLPKDAVASPLVIDEGESSPHWRYTNALLASATLAHLFHLLSALEAIRTPNLPIGSQIGLSAVLTPG